MQRFAKILTVALCLTLVGALFASGVKGPVANLTSKYGRTLITGIDDHTPLNPPRDHRGTLDDIIIDDNFDALAGGALPDGWTQVDVDGGFCAQFNRNSTWQAFNYTTNAHSQPNVLMCHYNDAALPNNDWLVLPQQTLDGPISLSFWSASQDVNYLESYEVKVSTAGNQPADFTHLVQAFTNVPTTWAQHTFDLTAYAGAPFYVAIHYNSVDKFVLKIDDLLLEAGAAGPMGAISGLVLDDGTGEPLSGVTVSGGGGNATTDGTGNYVMAANVGTHDVTFTKTGYDTYVATGVVVAENDTTQVDALMVQTPETNDDCAHPLEIGVGDTEYSTLEATIDATIADLPAECDEGFGVDFGPDVWFAFTSPGTGSARASTCDQADYDTRMAVYYAGGTEVPGCPTTNNDFLGCNDDGTNCTGFTSILDFDVVGGDVYLIRVGSFGTAIGSGTLTLSFTGVNVGDQPEGIPSNYAFQGAFPNPFNPTTQLKFDVPVTANVSLKVFNSIGQEVATVVDGLMNAGSHSVEFAGNNLPSGLYFAQLRSGSFVSTQKLVLMK